MTVLTRTDRPPSRRQIHLLADFVELRCLVSASGAFSAEELQDVRKLADQEQVGEEDVTSRELYFEDDAGVADAAVAAALDLTDLDSEPDLALPPEDAGSPTPEAGEAPLDDARDLEASDVVQHLRYRLETFGAAYPFRLRDDAVLELIEELSPRQWLYVLLLAASNLKHIRRKADRSTLTTYFEILGPVILRAYLGPRAKVELFGTSTTAAPDRYTGTLWEKLQVLEGDIRVRLVARNTDAEVDDANVGDHGVDVVAWFPFEDPASNLATLFGQSTCQLEWHNKILEPTEARWDSIFKFTSPLVNVLLIPYCFRRPDGSWYSALKVHRGVLLDRVRIFEVVSADVDLPEEWPRDLIQSLVAAEAVGYEIEEQAA